MATRRWTLGATALTLAIGLSACQGSVQGSGGTALGGSPSGVPVAVVSIDGPPTPVKTAFVRELTAAASSRQVDLVGAGAEARFRVRGYLSAETDADGETTLAFVWDVFDSAKQRAQRLTGSRPVRVAGSDSWSGLDKATLAELATESMDEIAGFLSASKSGQTAVAADTSGPKGALSFAAQ